MTRGTLRRLLVAFSVSGALLGACGSDEGGVASNQGAGGNGGSAGDAGKDAAPYASVSVEPAQVTLSVALGGSAQQVYKAFALIGGSKTDVTPDCNWSVDASFGSFSGATLTLKPRGGSTNVSAGCQGVTGTSALQVTLTGKLIAGTAPANADQLFQAAQTGSDPSHQPVIEYPLDGAVAPRNIPPVEAQWTAAGNDLFHVTLKSASLAIDAYTTDLELQLTASDWTSVVDTTAGDGVTYAVEGLVTSAPSAKYASTPVVLGLSTDRIENTSIYYWASSKGSLLEQVFGNVGSPSSVKGDCTSCHSVSRAGTRVGYSRCVAGDCGQLYGGFLKYDKATKQWTETLDANGKTLHGSYSTFAPKGNPFPDDSKSVALFALADGYLELYDPDTGQVAPSNAKSMSAQDPSNPAATRTATMPDWSPDGSTVVFASTPNAGQWIDISGSAIASMSYSYAGGTHTFGAPKLIVSQPVSLPSGSYDNFFFPSFSPDGKLIVFNAARAAWRNFTDAASPGQRLLLARNDGGWSVDLAKLNGPGDLDITWPHWAPSPSTDYLWVVFASQRDYGHRVTAANTAPECKGNGVKQCKQIWIGAIDRSQLPADGSAPTADPSAPPVWMPGQDLDADNISPYWTLPSSAIPQ